MEKLNKKEGNSKYEFASLIPQRNCTHDHNNKKEIKKKRNIKENIKSIISNTKSQSNLEENSFHFIMCKNSGLSFDNDVYIDQKSLLYSPKSNKSPKHIGSVISKILNNQLYENKDFFIKSELSEDQLKKFNLKSDFQSE